MSMDRADFEAGLAKDGFLETAERRLAPGEESPQHTHPFDARLLVLEGELILDRGGSPERYRAGETLYVPANERHAENAGPDGTAYLAGRRYP
jgi:quercetin dioxygenase-like cupin family protein